MKKQSILIVLSALLLFVFYSCSTEKKEYENIKSRYTLNTYTEYIKKYPNTVYIDSIWTRIIDLNWEEGRKNNTIENYSEFLSVCGGYQWENKALRMIGELYYKEVELINTFPAYIQFLMDSINTYSDSIEQKMQNLKLLRHPKLQNAKSIKLILTTQFPGKVRKDLEKIIRKELINIVIGTGLTRIGDSAEECDVTLTMDITGRGFGSNYSDIGIRFTNAEISGNISIETSNIKLDRKPFKAIFRGPYRIYNIDKWGHMKKEEDAPFTACLYEDNSVIPSMMEMIVKHFGYPTLIGTFNNLFESAGLPSNYDKIIPKNNEKAFQSLMTTLKNQTHILSRFHTPDSVYVEFIKDAGLIYLLGEMKDSRAINDIMNSCPKYTQIDEKTQMAKIDAIHNITGKKFKDFNELEKWWEEEKTKFNE